MEATSFREMFKVTSKYNLKAQYIFQLILSRVYFVPIILTKKIFLINSYVKWKYVGGAAEQDS